jgi:hypothetical protein
VTAAPQRRTVRRPHLDAHVVPVERALLALAGQSTEVAAELTEAFPGLGAQEATVNEIVAHAIAGHCRRLAEELHWVP